MIDHPDEGAVEGIERRIKVRQAKGGLLRMWELQEMIQPLIDQGLLTVQEGASLIAKHLNDPPRDDLGLLKRKKS